MRRAGDCALGGRVGVGAEVEGLEGGIRGKRCNERPMLASIVVLPSGIPRARLGDSSLCSPLPNRICGPVASERRLGTLCASVVESHPENATDASKP